MLLKILKPAEHGHHFFGVACHASVCWCSGCGGQTENVKNLGPASFVPLRYGARVGVCVCVYRGHPQGGIVTSMVIIQAGRMPYTMRSLHAYMLLWNI